MRIVIETIDHKDQVYPTVGDYRYDEEGTLQIKISNLGDEYLETLVAIHELIEERLLKKRGIPVSIIDEFDIEYEKERERGLHKYDEEPGFDKRSPYLDEHTFATSIEMAICSKMSYNWVEYSEKVNSL